VDVTAFAGQDVRLSLEWNIPEFFGGPAFFQLDAISVVEALIDSDGDGIADPTDNCTNVSNPNQIDSDLDGYGNPCDADFNSDGVVGGPDFGFFVTAFGAACGDPNYSAVVDLNSDCAIGGPDFVAFRDLFGGTPGPSGYSCAGTSPCP